MKRAPVSKLVFCFLTLSAAIVACSHRNPGKESAYSPVFAFDSSDKKTLLLGFPSFSYSETAEPLIKYFNAHLSGLQIKMKACVSYDEYLYYLDHNKFDLTIINGIQALSEVDKGYSIVGKVVDNDQYKGVIFIRRNAAIETIADLRRKTIAFVPSRTIPGTMMPLYYLYQNGLDVNHDIFPLNVSSFESAIIATYLHKSEAGVCLKRSWNVYIKNHPEILEKVELKWESPPLLNNALLVRNSIDSAKKSQLLNLFFSMQNNRDGKEALDRLEFNGFEKANTDTYKPMMDFKRKYDAVIH
jgi:phosphonate transport system substrate-binding protein